MALNLKILPQSSFGLAGYWGLQESVTIPFYNFESNSSNYFGIKDWGISLQYSTEFSGSVNSSLYLLAIAKKLDNHSLSARYTPGYQKEFIFKTGESIIINDTTTQSLQANYNYKELFGLGYSYSFNEQFNAGLTMRFFSQDFNREIVKPVFGDTLYLIRETVNEKISAGSIDVGLDYILSKQLQFRIASINLLNFEDQITNDEFQGFELKLKRGALLTASYFPFETINLHLLYETSNSFQAGVTGHTNGFIYGLTAFHDYYQEPFVAGVLPAAGYRTKMLEVLLSGVLYFSERSTNATYSKFYDEGINNIINNRYSFNKIVLSMALNISGIPEKQVELIDVEIVRDIYPTFYDKYIEQPFAYGRVVNISDKPVSIIPSVKIEGLTDDRIQSPPQTIAPGDTASVPFFVIISDKYSIDKTILSYADFFVSVASAEPDAQLQKAALINGINSWDGNVFNLRYFIKRDFEFSMNYTKNILSQNKSILDTISTVLLPFFKAQIIFNEFARKIVYASDPRATAEYVQFPKQTLELKGGDCDDLSVLYSSLLESVGVQTALVDYKGDGEIRHVNVLVNTGLKPEQARLITLNDKKYFIRKDETGKDRVWIPIETTSLTEFSDAWNVGVEKFNREAIDELGLAKGTVEIIEVY
jgi:hypothetical protein